MNGDYLIVVDMQKDFINGSLGTEEAERILPKVINKIKGFDGEVVFTLDTHGENYLDTAEGRLLPVRHCIKNTKGWELADELKSLAKGRRVFEKNTFGSVKLAKTLLEEYDKGKVASVCFVGLCTDICVISNALLIKAYMPELPVYADVSCMAGVTPEKHQAAVEVMKSCQIIIKGENKNDTV